MASNKMFTIAGTSILNRVETFRFATGEIAKRVWVLTHNGHTNVALVALPNEMDKLGAIAWLQAQGIGNNAVLPNAVKAKKAEVIAPVKTQEEIDAEEKAAKKEAFLAKMTAGREAAKAKKAALESATQVEVAGLTWGPTAIELRAWV